MSGKFYDQIYAEIRKVGSGELATYGQIAKRVGMPRGAQVVGWALRAYQYGSSVSDLPWQRIVGKGGRIVINNQRLSQDLQKDLLELEGHKFKKDQGYWQILNWEPE